MRRYDLTNARWRKSTYSGGDDGETCVEVAYDFPGGARWRKSTHSSGDAGEECVEIADGVPGVVPVRDSKVPDGPVLVIGALAWTKFVSMCS
ncbi:DUF397 domain-containing protein [Streptomyces sp. TRM68367]|uniref:DUF397 domain-containing protein n=1 Tax=Streptomyces sp. TRM68367 TaxID=2758415 RepID=UPI00165BDE2F|nr:DUF397 domain-containing protein [Streptomyces sp. TRM68367]MBC9726831.1 DUF397 domain-containing protein [Streptomyces sp. TRM68367]